MLTVETLTHKVAEYNAADETEAFRHARNLSLQNRETNVYVVAAGRARLVCFRNGYAF